MWSNEHDSDLLWPLVELVASLRVDPLAIETWLPGVPMTVALDVGQPRIARVARIGGSSLVETASAGCNTLVVGADVPPDRVYAPSALVVLAARHVLAQRGCDTRVAIPFTELLAMLMGQRDLLVPMGGEMGGH